MILLASITVVAITIRFDGSLRYPNDPGFPSAAASACGAVPLSRHASCAACLVVSSKDEKEEIVALGGKLLDKSSNVVQTSGQAEYEGLLLGLEYFVSTYGTTTTTTAANSRNGVNTTGSNTTTIVKDNKLIIQGDCKTVIHQLVGTSKPRKLEGYYQRACDLLEQIPCHVELQHVPRKQNQLADGIANAILCHQEACAVQAAMRDLIEWKQGVALRSDTAHDEEIPLSNVWNRHAPSIAFSRRPIFYRFLAKLSTVTSDYKTLVSIGEQLETEARSIWSKAQYHQSSPPPPPFVVQNEVPSLDVQSLRDRLLVEAVVYQICGLRCLGKTRQAQFREQRTRVLLKRQREYAKCIERSLLNQSAASDNVCFLDRLLLASGVNNNNNNISSSTEDIKYGWGLQASNATGNPWSNVINQWCDEAFSSPEWEKNKVFWMDVSSSDFV